MGCFHDGKRSREKDRDVDAGAWGRDPFAAEAAAALNLFFGGECGAVGGSFRCKAKEDFIRGSGLSEVVVSPREPGGIEIGKDLLGEEEIWDCNEAIAFFGMTVDVIAEGDEMADLFPDSRAA